MFLALIVACMICLNQAFRFDEKTAQVNPFKSGDRNERNDAMEFSKRERQGGHYGCLKRGDSCDNDFHNLNVKSCCWGLECKRSSRTYHSWPPWRKRVCDYKDCKKGFTGVGYYGSLCMLNGFCFKKCCLGYYCTNRWTGGRKSSSSYCEPVPSDGRRIHADPAYDSCWRG